MYISIDMAAIYIYIHVCIITIVIIRVDKGGSDKFINYT